MFICAEKVRGARIKINVTIMLQRVIIILDFITGKEKFKNNILTVLFTL